MESTADNTDEVISAGELLRLLDSDAREISALCQKACLKPKKDGFGNIYFSKGDVDILRKMKELWEQTKRIQEERDSYPEQGISQKSKIRKIQRKVEKIEPQRFEFEDIRASKTGFTSVRDEIPASTGLVSVTAPVSQSAVMKKMDVMEANVVSKITDILSEKLDGLDEVIVELIRAKTENENLRQKVNELNKENFALKSENASYKPVGLGFYVKKSSDNFTF